MTRLALFVIAVATPPEDREWVVGDTIEEFGRLQQSRGPRVARGWLWREMCRIVLHAPLHRHAVRSRRRTATRTKGDGPMSAMWQDVRYAVRQLVRSPGFSLVAIITLALGIGANTAMFAVVHALLFKPLPFHDADRLMLVHLLVPDLSAGRVMREGRWSYPKYQTFAAAQDVFADTAIFAARDVSIALAESAERVRGEVVTDRYPAVLGIAPILGRPFTPDEAHREGAPAAALIGHGLWSRRFGRDPAVLGQTLQIDRKPYAIVGVLPAGFRGLSGNADVWMPFAAFEPEWLTQRQGHGYYLIARRSDADSQEAAIAAVQVIGRQIDAEYRNPSRDGVPWGATARSLDDSRVDQDMRRAALLLLAAVGFVLLIACANLASLLIARVMSRRREVAVRIAIGASRARIAKQFIVESAVLAGFGASAGVLISTLLLAGASALLPEADVFFRTPVAQGVPRLLGAEGLTRIGAGMIGLDVMTLLFTGGVTMMTAILVALVPALQASLLRPAETLKIAGSAGTARGLRGIGARAGLVTVQIALALVLLAGAGLMMKSAARLYAVGAGIAPERLLTARIDLPSVAYNRDATLTFYTKLAERLRAMPGIDGVGLANCAPLSGGCNGTTIGFERGKHPQGRGAPGIGIHWATPEYFIAAGIPLLRGRLFSDRDRIGQPKVAIVSETAARRYWPDADPIGKAVTLGQGAAFHEGAEVVGVVADVRYDTLEEAMSPQAYIPFLQSPPNRMRLFLRTRLEPEQMVAVIRAEVRALDPSLPLSEVKTMEERLDDAMWRTRLGAWLFAVFAGLAVLLTAIGIFGVMAQTVSQRRMEMGIRLALGAQSDDVLRLILRSAAVLTAVGLMIGLGAALAFAKLIAALLYDVAPNDPVTFAVVALLLGCVSLAASYVPARRIMRVDAVVALRSE